MKRTRLLLGMVALLASCRGSDLTLIPQADLPQDVYGEPVEVATSPGQIPDEGVVYLVKEGRLEPVARKLPPARSLPEALVLALLEGGALRETDFDTAVPQNTRLLSLTLEQNIATVDLSGEFDSGATGVPQQLRLAQVVYTLTGQPTGVLGVLFSVEGESKDVVIDSGIVVGSPVTRQHYRKFAPQPEGDEGGG